MKTLPGPDFVERNSKKVTTEIIKMYEDLTGKKLQPAHVERVLIDIIAYRESLLRVAIQEAAKQCLVEYARYPMIDHLGRLVDTERLSARPARTVLRCTLEGIQGFDVVIGKEKIAVWSKDNKVLFTAISDVMAPSGALYADVEAEAQANGTIGNGYFEGEINVLQEPLAGVSKIENITVTGSGSDAEDDERYRERIKTAPEHFSTAGPEGGYLFWALTAHQDITDVAVVSPEPGKVDVYALAKNGEPTQGLMDLVDRAVNSEKVRPLTDFVQVKPAVRVRFNIDADLTLLTGADGNRVKNEVVKRLENYAVNLRARFSRDIVPSQIIGVADSVPDVHKVELNSPLYRELQPYEFADCTGINTNITGYNDG